MTKKKTPKPVKTTKNNKKNTPLSTKLLILTKAISSLCDLIEQTKEECKRRRRKFDALSKLYDPEDVVYMLDEVFRQVAWLNDEQRDYLEVYTDDEPSCVIVNDVFIYINRISELMSEIE